LAIGLMIVRNGAKLCELVITDLVAHHKPELIDAVARRVAVWCERTGEMFESPLLLVKLPLLICFSVCEVRESG
jgi:hypothetical protein